MDKLKVFFKRASSEEIEIIEINNELKDLQTLVGGHLQVIAMPSKNDLLLVMNEEGKLLDLPINFFLGDFDFVVGDVFFTKAGGEDFISLTEEDIEEVKLFLRER